MSQDNNENSIVAILSNPELAKHLKILIREKRIARFMRGINPLRNRDGVKDKIRDLIVRYPGLFSDFIAMGYSTMQILEYYANKK